MIFSETQKRLIKDASEFLGESEEYVIERIKNIGDSAIEDWNNKKSIEDFYMTTDHYIFDLIKFCNPERLDNLLHPVKNFENLKVLDYGGGIGIIAQILAEKNIVFYYDLPSMTQDFAKYVNRNFDVVFLDKEKVFTKKYDMIVCADVLEHVENPLELTRYFLYSLNKRGFFLTTGLNFSSGPHIPMHLTKNYEYFDDFMNMLYKECALIFYHSTQNESIYLWVKK